MKWYKKFPADFGVDTRDLNLTEIGVYNELLDWYYTTEKPLPPDLAALCRIANTQTSAERKAVARIADKFFPPNGDGFRHNKRADEEIAKAQSISEQRRIAGAKGGAIAPH